MVVITFKNGVTHIYNSDSPKLIQLWKRVEEISSVVYGIYMDADLAPAPVKPPKPAKKAKIESSKETLGDFVKAHRSRKGLKQSELISALNMDGNCKVHRTFKDGSQYNKNFISRVENDRVRPSLLEFQCILQELDLEYNDPILVGRWYHTNGQYKKPE